MATALQIAATQGRRGLLVIRARHPPLDLPGAHDSGDSLAVRSPHGRARSHSVLDKTSLRSTSQEPTKLANGSQFAAP